MNHFFIKKVLFPVSLYILLIPLNLHAAKPADSIPDDLVPALDYLLDNTGSDVKKPLNLDLIPRILDFVESPKELGKSMNLGDYNGAASDYFEVSVNQSLGEVLDLAYNPDLPSNLTQPSSVRCSRWTEIDDQSMSLPSFSDELKHLDKPLIMRGIEFVENSPDTFSGAYYSYDLDRLLILIKHKGRPALISVSNQRDRSDVGKKGIIVGNDGEWNYIYSGEKGTTLRVTGWADTYMYYSASITVYYELGVNPALVKCAVFKWLDAGWMGINFVKPAHIRKGLERFAKDFKEIVESPNLADIQSLVQAYQKIYKMPLDELRSRTAEYYNQENLDRLLTEDSKHKKWITKLFKQGKYINKMNRQEMEALVSIEYLKYKMGRRDAVESGYFPE